jgi:protein Tex
MQTSPPPPEEVGRLDLSRIAQDLQIRKVQVEAVVQLLDEGNTIPFITRYRKERTGGLDEEILRTIEERVALLRQLAERKQTILKSITGQNKLTDELKAAILAADNPKRLEDLYLPYKPKKRTLATTAREKGLEPLALAIWNRDPAVNNLEEVLPTLVNLEKELNTIEDVKTGVQHILAEMIAEAADVRAGVRAVLWDTGKLCTTKSEKLAEGTGLDYKDYFQFNEPVRHIPPHRILAINRGEKENALVVKFEWDAATGQRVAEERLPVPLPETAVPVPVATVEAPPAETDAANAPTPPDGSSPAPPPRHQERRGRHEPQVPRGEALRLHPHAELLKVVTTDALARLLVPSLEREIRRELTQRAEGHAVHVFARNLRSKLLAAPLRGKRVLAIDPGFRTGCKLAVLDETGNLLEDGVVYPHSGTNKRNDAKAKLAEMICRHQTSIIAIGNGTACRETEEIVSEVIAHVEALARGEVPPLLPAPAPTPEPAPAPALLAPGEAIAAPAEAPPLPPVEGAPLEAPPIPEASAAPAETPPAPEATTALAPVEPPPPAEPLPPPPADLAYVIVNEAGASVYSASPVGREEFPSFDATLRGTISIGRRLQDPLSELVKIDPQHVGVGLYQHDVSPKQLRESLEGVVESCVNTVGVDLNTASVPLLRYVSGLNQLVARDLVEYRKTNGSFQSRDQLLQVPGIGEQRFIQAAGFLKISGGVNPLDRTWIHPESYPVARQVLADLGYAPETLEDKDKLAELREKLKTVSPEEVAARLQVGTPTVRDILDALARPGRDPREDLPPPIFKKGILKLEDLQSGMELKGTVLNVVDFGAFIDIGLKDSGLVHISQMANRYVKSPYDVASVGDVVTVWVMAVDKERRRVSLTMIQPGTERKPPEKKAPPPRREAPPPRRESTPPQRQEGGGQQRQYGGRPPQRGPQRGGPPPRGGRPPHYGQRGQEPQTEGATAAAAAAKAPPPRKPRRAPPKPNLSQSALAGASPLGTFAELAAFWEAKKVPPTPAGEPAPTAEAAPTPEPTPSPPPEPPAATEGGETPPPG